MIIDAHVHALGRRDWWPGWAWDAINSIQGARAGKTKKEMAKYRDASFDPKGDVTIENMDRAGVDKAMVCVADFGLAVPGEDTKLPIEDINRLTYEIVKNHSDRLFFSVGVDPRRKNALEILKTGVNELESKALKLYPGAGWYPNDRLAYRLYEKCIDANLPVNFHTGPVFGPMKSKFSHPFYIDDVAADFPELKIYCTHCGHGAFMEMLAIARMRSNIFCDLAGWLSWIYAGETLHFYQMWRYIMNMMGSDRVLFASDQTGLRFTLDLKDEYVDWVTALTQVPDWAEIASVAFKKEELENFFSNNAIRLLDLK